MNTRGFQDKIGKDNIIKYSYYNDYNNLTIQDFQKQRPSKFVFLVGFPKTATSTISAILHNHHNVLFPTRKEPFYFATEEYNFGLGFYWEKYFNPNNKILNGYTTALDCNTANSFLPYAPRRIKESIPDANIIFSLRDPIKRAYSNWRMYVGSGEEDLSFERAIDWEIEEIEKGLLDPDDEEFWRWYMKRLVTRDYFIRRKTIRTYLTRGLYAKHINRYMTYFENSNLYYVFQEDILNDKKSEMYKIFDWLKLQPTEFPNQNFHVSSKNVLIRNYISRTKLPQVMDNVLPSNISKRFKKIVNDMMPKDQMNSRTYDRLKEFYKQPNQNLQSLLSRDLPW